MRSRIRDVAAENWGEYIGWETEAFQPVADSTVPFDLGVMGFGFELRLESWEICDMRL